MAEPTLKRGRQNPRDWVEYAQKMLNHALAGGMHIDIPENGVFDEEMEREVMAFQSRYGLNDDGEIGPQTWAALHAAADARAAAVAEPDSDVGVASRYPQREVEQEIAPGRRPDDEIFHTHQDQHGNTVRDYDMDAETITVTPGALVDWNAVVATLIGRAENNTGEQIPYVLVAIDEFQQSSHAKIAKFVHDAQIFEEARVAFPWGLLVDALDSGLSAVFKLEGPGGWIFDKVTGAFTSQLVGELEAHASQVPGLQAQLDAGVAALSARVRRESTAAVDAVKAEIRPYIQQQMREYTQVTNDPEWIAEMVAWLGFPPRSQANVTQPILSWLNHQFDTMLRDASEQLVRNA
ncbi:MAG TPA: peptidoglycan-binding domain-containing protein [Acidimicrobiales bacterium]|nr:peptidoglycan-binding domain-containing protein [Acidimicrobiales bacterium]